MPHSFSQLHVSWLGQITILFILPWGFEPHCHAHSHTCSYMWHTYSSLVYTEHGIVRSEHWLNSLLSKYDCTTQVKANWVFYLVRGSCVFLPNLCNSVALPLTSPRLTPIGRWTSGPDCDAPCEELAEKTRPNGRPRLEHTDPKWWHFILQLSFVL